MQGARRAKHDPIPIISMSLDLTQGPCFAL